MPLWKQHSEVGRATVLPLQKEAEAHLAMCLFKVTWPEAATSQLKLSHLEHTQTTPKAKWLFAKQGINAQKQVTLFSHNYSDNVGWGQGIIPFSWIWSRAPSSA